ncbi:MAG: hypothetical protein ACOWWR_13650 [Eubacteriales bacterium]
MKNWITTEIELDTNKKEKNRFLNRKFTLDAKGNILEEIEYDIESNILCKRIYRYFDTDEIQEYIEYDAIENMSERHSYYKNELGYNYLTEFEYSSGHKIIKESSFADNGSYDKTIIKDESGEIIGYEVYEFNDQGLVVKEIELDSDNNEVSRYEKIYDGNDNLIIEKHYQDGSLHTGESFEYDDNDNVVRTIHRFYHEEYETIETFRYDVKNNMIYNAVHQNGVLIFENILEYNEGGNVISEECFELNYWQNNVIRHSKRINELEIS